MSVVMPLAVAALSTALFALLHWRGIPLSPDGWAYWQAAVGIANGAGYRDFSGNALIAWPPLYSIYLSLWVRLMGATGLALVMANGALIVLQSVAWFVAMRRILGVARVARPAPVNAAIALYVGIYVPLTFQAAHANNLGFLFACLLLHTTWQSFLAQTSERRTAWLLASIAAATLALLSHNINLAFVATCAFVLLLLQHQSRRDYFSAAQLFLIPVAIWLLVRWHLGQLGSHPVGAGLAQFGPFQYLIQTAAVIGNLVVPSVFGAPLFVSIALFAWCIWISVFRSQSKRAASTRFVVGIVVGNCALLILMFSVTSVTDPIGARFVGWVPLIVVPAILINVSRMGLAALIAATCLVLAPNIHRLIVFATIHADLGRQKEIGVLFPIGALISPTYTSGPAVETNRGLLIAPPR